MKESLFGLLFAGILAIGWSAGLFVYGWYFYEPKPTHSILLKEEAN